MEALLILTRFFINLVDTLLLNLFVVEQDGRANVGKVPMEQDCGVVEQLASSLLHLRLFIASASWSRMPLS